MGFLLPAACEVEIVVGSWHLPQIRMFEEAAILKNNVLMYDSTEIRIAVSKNLILEPEKLLNI